MVLGVLLSGSPAVAEPGHWGYGADDGPAVWSSLSPKYALCSSGREQSPIDLRDAQAADHALLAPNYLPGRLRIFRHEHVVDVLDNGHTIQVTSDEGSTLELDGKTYALAQYHFHAPSEHTIAGRSFPMEMHLVHQSADGGLVVLGVLIEAGAHHVAFEPVWAHLPREPGQETHLDDVSVDISDLLPTSRRTYRYRGSLTTPPCSEGVSWLVAAQPIQLSADQIRAFTEIIPANNRPVQPLGERSITIDRGVEQAGATR